MFSGDIPLQDAIKVNSVNGDSPLGNDVEIAQADGLGNDDAKITMCSQNVVRLCRQILWAADFKDIKIAHRVSGLMWSDINDGDEAGNHY